MNNIGLGKNVSYVLRGTISSNYIAISWRGNYHGCLHGAQKKTGISFRYLIGVTFRDEDQKNIEVVNVNRIIEFEVTDSERAELKFPKEKWKTFYGDINNKLF